MAKVKKATPKKAVAKTGTFSYQAPGASPSKMKFKVGQTLGEVFDAAEIVVDDYEIFANGSKVSTSYIPANSDVVRVGIKTKHGF